MSFTAEIEKELVGAVLDCHDGRCGYIHYLAVSPNHRRLGFGQLPVDCCLKALKDIGVVECHLFIFKNNELGLKIWESVGQGYRSDFCVQPKFIGSEED